MRHEFFPQVVRFLHTRLESYICVNGLTLDIMGIAYNGGLGHLFMGNEGAFNFRGPQSVPGNIDNVIDPAHELIIAVFVPGGSIAGIIESGALYEVGLLEPHGIPVYTPHDPGPWLLYAEGPACNRCSDLRTALINNGWIYPHKGDGGLARFEINGAGQRRDENASCLGLPPRIHNRQFVTPDIVVIPVPRLGVNRLAHRA